MSIKSIDTPTLSNSEGISKKINKGAEKMVFDILQATQYSTPIPSTVRELVSNACDSQREKEIALEILSGEKEVSDYYIERDGDQYKDSNFDPSYYDINSLDEENNDVIINYHENDGVGYCDKFEVIDYGVGIGGKRLEGILELGYSTKRNTSENFGAFGLGAKVALSTGVDFYTIETVHNGKKFMCNCYPYKTDFLTPKFNPYIEFSDGTKVHYEETDSKNYTKISFGVKKHNRRKFEESIYDQLNYLHNVKFFVVYGELNVQRHFHSEVIHNSDNIIVAKSYGYAKPHIVVVKSKESTTGINYGYIDFKELELEQLYGSVGLKCPIRQSYTDSNGMEVIIQDGVEVTPSREKVIWSENTKDYILKTIKSASAEASRMIEKSLEETDLIKWTKACNNITNKGSRSDDALGQISKIINTSDLRPRFSKNNSIVFQGIETFFLGFNVRRIEYTSDFKDPDKKSLGKELKIKTTPLKSWSEFDKKIYYSEESISKVKSYTIASLEESKSFILITPKRISTSDEESISDELKQTHLKTLTNYNKLKSHIKDSSEVFDYDAFEVTEELLEAYERAKSVYEKVTGSESFLTPEERRALNNSIVLYSIRVDYRGYNQTLVLDKVEPTLKQIKNSKFKYVYGKTEDVAKIKFAYWMYLNDYPDYSTKFHSSCEYRYDLSNMKIAFFDAFPLSLGKLPPLSESEHDILTDEFKHLPVFVKVSSKVEKLIKDFDNVVHIDEFLCSWDSKSKTINVDKKLKAYFTYKLIQSPPSWFSQLSFISPVYSEVYSYLNKYTSGWWRHSSVSEALDELEDYFQFFQRCIDLQKFVLEVKDQEDSKELIASKSKELLIFTDVAYADIYDEHAVILSNEVQEFASDMDCFLSNLSFSSDDNFKRELLHYLKSKGKLEFEFSLPEPSKS